MYRYIECEKYEGKTLRTGGITERSLMALKHLSKVGQVRYVRGYIYTGRNGTQHAGVLVRGELGSIRFGGFSWGYNGEGPRGLEKLFDCLGVKNWCRRLVQSTRWPGFALKDVGEWWRITFGDQISVKRQPAT
jgi:hypothetical protein